MVFSATVFKRGIKVQDSDFDIDAIYKGFKRVVDSLGYRVVEKEHIGKPGKYGGEIKFKIGLSKEYDFFGKCEGEVEFFFNNLSKSKGKDHGDAKIVINNDMKLDYKNRWGMTKFNKILFGIYMKIKKPEFDAKYLKSVIVEGTKMDNFLKDQLGLETA